MPLPPPLLLLAGREIEQPTVVDPVSFMVWKDEAFELWQSSACLRPLFDYSSCTRIDCNYPVLACRFISTCRP
jgi:hypothetical protein